MCCVADTELASTATTSSSSSSSAGCTSVKMTKMSSDDNDGVTMPCRQQPRVFGDLLSSMHREVESTLRQFGPRDTPPTTTTTPLTPATLSLSPCVRDVCDAIIVHALQQGDVTDPAPAAPESGQQRPVDTGGPQSCMTDSELRATNCINPGQYSHSQLSSQLHFIETSNYPLQSSRLSDSVKDSSSCFNQQHSPLIDTRSQESHMTESKSCLTDSKSHSSESRLTESSSQVTDVKTKQSELDGHDSESGSERCQSRLSDDKSCVLDCDMKQMSSTVSDVADTSSTTVAVADDGDDDDVRKTEADASSQEADDEDQPLCIDLNRDLSPDDDHQSVLTPRTDTTTI